MEMEDHYGLADPRHLMSGRVHFPPISPPPDLYSGHRNQLAAPPSQPYEMLMMAPPGSHDIMMHHHHHQDHHQFQSDYNAHATVTATPAGAFGGGLEAVDMGCLGGDGGTGRWPRQETLTLLEIRSRLDSKFKEANQKGPLWDEVSRIMNEEHGYQRSGKKCREKFENLYKYYKKTKEGKAGRQDGKHYRFFRQLEALYGSGATCDTAAYNNGHQFTATQAVPQPQKLSDSLSLSNNSSELDTSSSHHDDDDSAEAGEGKKRTSGGKRSWKAKIREFVDSQMRRLVEKQETWLETMQRSLEHKERERMLRDDAWRKQEASRMDRQQRFWASERAWIKARDAALVEALHTLTSQSQAKNTAVSDNTTTNNDGWSECEIARLVQLRTEMDERFGQIGCSEESLWEEIAAEMGYQRSASMCKEKWTSDITNNNDDDNHDPLFLKDFNVISKKRKEHSTRSYCYFPTAADSGYDHVVGAGAAAAAAAETVPYFEMDERGPKMAAQTSELLNGSSSSSPCDPSPNGAQEGCFRMLMANGGSNLWEDYGLKLN